MRNLRAVRSTLQAGETAVLDCLFTAASLFRCTSHFFVVTSASLALAWEEEEDELLTRFAALLRMVLLRVPNSLDHRCATGGWL